MKSVSIDALRRCVNEACELVNEMLNQPMNHWRKADSSPVTDIDLAVDTLLRDRLLPLAPDAGWLCEESPADDERLQRERVWVVDPIDGTRSLLDGHPEFCVSVALVVRGVGPVMGVIQNPSTMEQFWAVRGGGAWRGQRRLSVAQQAGPLRWLVSRSERARGQWHKPPGPGSFEVAGGLAWKMALVAAGQFHGTVTPWPRSEWDAAAGSLLVEEAGGRCTDGRFRPLRWNQPDPTFQGIVCAAESVWHHAERLSRWSDGEIQPC